MKTRRNVRSHMDGLIEMNGLIDWVYLALLFLFGFNLTTVLPATAYIHNSRVDNKIINIIL